MTNAAAFSTPSPRRSSARLSPINHVHLAPEGIAGFIDAFAVARIGAVRLADSAGAVAVHLPLGPGNIDFPATFRRQESAGYNDYYTMAFGSIADQLAARELFRTYAI